MEPQHAHLPAIPIVNCKEVPVRQFDAGRNSIAATPHLTKPGSPKGQKQAGARQGRTEESRYLPGAFGIHGTLTLQNVAGWGWNHSGSPYATPGLFFPPGLPLALSAV